MARKKPLPANFVHFRCASQLTEALDRVAEEHDITRSEAARILLELYLFNDTNLIAGHEGIAQVKTVLRIAQGQAFESYLASFNESIANLAKQGAGAGGLPRDRPQRLTPFGRAAAAAAAADPPPGAGEDDGPFYG